MRYYRVYLTKEVHDFLLAQRAADRRRLDARLMAIRDNPDEFSDMQGRDDTDRAINIHYFGLYRIHYWVDDVVKVINFIAIFRGRQFR